MDVCLDNPSEVAIQDIESTQINFCVQCGDRVDLKTLFGKQRPVCPSCGWIYFSDPKVAVGVLIENGDKVLLVRRVNEPFKGLWTLPAGFVDREEDPVRAAERECLEETGLTVSVTDLQDVIHGQEHPRGAHIMIVYRAQITDGVLQPGDDVDRAAFFSYENLPELAFSTTTQILNSAMSI